MKEGRAIRSLEDLKEIRNRIRPLLNPEDDSIRVVVGLATCGVAAGAQPVYQALKTLVQEEGISGVRIVPTGCVGICQFEPVVEVYQKGVRTTYVHMSPEKVKRVVRQHLRGGNVVTEFTIGARL